MTVPTACRAMRRDGGQSRAGRSRGIAAAAFGLLFALPLIATAGSAESEEIAALPGDPARILDLHYEIYAGGLHALTVDARVNLGAERYDAALQLRTDGWLAWLLDFTMESEVTGHAAPQGLKPERFRTASVWQDNERWVEMAYAGNALPEVDAVPPPEDDDRELVPPALRRGTVDPLSAGLGLVHRLGETARCGGDAAVFDGRRLFQATARHIGEATLSASGLAPFSGAATACRLTVEPVTGFWKKQDYKVEPKDVTVYFQPVIEGGPPIPVRVEAESRFGAVRVHLVAAQPAVPTD